MMSTHKLISLLEEIKAAGNDSDVFAAHILRQANILREVDILQVVDYVMQLKGNKTYSITHTIPESPQDESQPRVFRGGF